LTSLYIPRCYRSTGVENLSSKQWTLRPPGVLSAADPATYPDWGSVGDQSSWDLDSDSLGSFSDDPGWGSTGDDPSWGSEGDGGVHWSAPFPVNGTVYEVKKSGKECFS
jgi:hypothetical protein